jgi:Leucine-rich repeat (LRR) protein
MIKLQDCCPAERELIAQFQWVKKLKLNAAGQVISLNLSDNQLENLPTEIGQLNALQNLNLHHNKITNLPSQIGQLFSLRTLNLSENYLTELPPAIGFMKTLQILDLSSNRLIHLPPEIGQLNALQSLDITQNKLKTLPPEIGQLVNLQSLFINHNQLSCIPPEIERMSNLQTLYLLNNPWSFFFDSFIVHGNCRTIKKNLQRFSNFLPQICEKIQNNLPLDAFDRAFPEFPRYKEILERYCLSVSTETGRELRDLLESVGILKQGLFSLHL